MEKVSKFKGGRNEHSAYPRRCAAVHEYLFNYHEREAQHPDRCRRRAGVYLKALDEAGAALTHILLTHGHYDHVGAVAALKKATGCKVYMGRLTRRAAEALPLTPDVLTDNWPANDELTIDELTFKIYHTPGHTGGGVCLSCYGLLFSGDTLFAGSCGRTDFPGGSMQEMAKALSAGRAAAAGCNKSPAGHEGFPPSGRSAAPILT